MRHRSPDFWSGLALASLGAYIIFCASGWDYATPEGPGPGFFPLWYGIAMLGISLVLVVSPSAVRVDWRGGRRALATWLALVVCIAALKWLGFVVRFVALPLFIVAVVFRGRLSTGGVVGVGAA